MTSNRFLIPIHGEPYMRYAHRDLGMSLGMEERQVARFDKNLNRVLSFVKRVLKITIIQRPLIDIMAAFGVALSIAYGYRYLEPSRFVAFIASLFVLYEPVKKITKVHITIQHAMACGQRIF